MTNLQAQNDASMSAELRQVANGFAYRVKSFGAYDVNGYRFHTTKHEQIWPNQRTTNTGVFTPRDDGLEFFQLPVPNNEDYNIDPNTYTREFF